MATGIQEFLKTRSFKWWPLMATRLRRLSRKLIIANFRILNHVPWIPLISCVIPAFISSKVDDWCRYIPGLSYRYRKKNQTRLNPFDDTLSHSILSPLSESRGPRNISRINFYDELHAAWDRDDQTQIFFDNKCAVLITQRHIIT
ncbi:hypothetical protein NPIL_629071 [Nephila pilipes]|uniref:Uncharacterized protein n=1 Tax=Nephila pilipes TaxID=299642 RepID=A0A8X6UN68_NEPPI|nr:hypothetical protein NPIL_629071 [Nephila pilipes]